MELTMPSWLRSACAFEVNQTELMMDQSKLFTIPSLFKSPANGITIGDGDGDGAGAGVTVHIGSDAPTNTQYFVVSFQLYQRLSRLSFTLTIPFTNLYTDPDAPGKLPPPGSE